MKILKLILTAYVSAAALSADLLIDTNILSNGEIKKGGGGGSHGGGGGSGGHGRGEGDSSGGHGGGEGGSNGGSGEGSSGSSGSGGKGGSSSSGSSGKGDASPKADSHSKGYGNDHLPSYAESQVPPPPYSAGKGAPPNPQHATTSYGQTGPTRTYWNGQYYPYNSFGYGPSLFPLGFGLGFMPLYFAGPFGFYGHYGAGSSNATVKNFYYGGHNSTTNSTSEITNGTYYTLDWADGAYTVVAETGGKYRCGVALDNQTYVNGTFIAGPNDQIKTSKVNPNVTVNGTALPEDEQKSSNKAITLSPAYLLLAVTLLL